MGPRRLGIAVDLSSRSDAYPAAGRAGGVAGREASDAADPSTAIRRRHTVARPAGGTARLSRRDLCWRLIGASSVAALGGCARFRSVRGRARRRAAPAADRPRRGARPEHGAGGEPRRDARPPRRSAPGVRHRRHAGGRARRRRAGARGGSADAARAAHLRADARGARGRGVGAGGHLLERRAAGGARRVRDGRHPGAVGRDRLQLRPRRGRRSASRSSPGRARSPRRRRRRPGGSRRSED